MTASARRGYLMPESEIFKMVMQGGMLALWMVFGWWCLSRGVPMVKDEIKNMTSSHQSMVKDLTCEFTKNTADLNSTHKDACRSMAESHREAVECLNKTHREVVDQLAKECREERKELLHVVYAKIGIHDGVRAG